MFTLLEITNQTDNIRRMAETVRPPEFSSEEEVAHILLRNQVFQIADYPKFRWSGGLMSPVYSDLKLIPSDVDGRTKINDLFRSQIQRERIPNAIAGIVFAGTTWATDAATSFRLPLVNARTEPKDHGMGKQIEGRVNPGDYIVAFEDTLSSGASSIAGCEGLRKEGAIVDTIYTILDYQLFNSKEKAAKAGLRIKALTTFPVVMKVAEQNGYFNPDEIAVTKEWYPDPYAWAEKFEK